MKDLIIVLTVIIIIFVPGYYTQKYLEKSGAEIIEIVEELKEEIRNDNMENFNKIEKLRIMWIKEQDWWNILSNHQNTDEVQREIQKLVTNYENKEKMDALINLTEIKSIIEDVPKGEGILLVNIL